MPTTHSLEEFVANLNQNLFFREFSFSQNKFSPTPSEELELADHVVWLDDLLVTYQVKERKQKTGEVRTSETERAWFKNKVLKKATKQIRDTQKYFASYPQIYITNEKGHTFDVKMAKVITRINLILHQSDPLLPDECRLQKHYVSSTAGFMHLMAATDYAAVCQILVTPAEISEYLQFREQLVSRYAETKALSEDCLLGQFLSGDDEAMPNVLFASYPRKLRQDKDVWDFSFMLNLYESRIIDYGDNVADAFQYYRILQELAKLNRQELREVKLRFKLCLEKCQDSDVNLPYRLVSPHTGCGFVFAPVPPDYIEQMKIGLENFTAAHKYDQKLDKCVGVVVASERLHRGTSTYLIAWCLIEESWSYDAIMEKQLRESFPFREVGMNQSPRYHFD